MNRLFVGLLSSAFAFGSVAAMADGQTPAQPVQAKQYNGNDPYGGAPVRTPKGTPLIGDFRTPRDRALLEMPTNDKTMTPKEKAAAKKAKRAKKQQEASAIAKEADTGSKMGQQQKDEADLGAGKAQPKALPEARPRIGVPLDRRYSEPLPPGGPAQRDPAKSNP